MFSTMRRAVPAFRAAASRAVTGRVAVAASKSNALAAAGSTRLLSTMDTMESGTPTCECTDVLANACIVYAMQLTSFLLFRYRHVALS